jgi:hypothetical protein
MIVSISMIAKIDQSNLFFRLGENSFNRNAAPPAGLPSSLVAPESNTPAT